jgi:CheY-like chemotaxis protein
MLVEFSQADSAEDVGSEQDEALVQMAAKRVLERAGYTVAVAGNGREALDILAALDEDDFGFLKRAM